MCILIIGGFLIIAEQHLLKWHLSKLLGNSPTPQNRVREAVTIDAFLSSFQDSAEMLTLYEMGDGGEGGLECFLSGKMVEGAVSVFVHQNSWTAWTLCKRTQNLKATLSSYNFGSKR